MANTNLLFKFMQDVSEIFTFIVRTGTALPQGDGVLRVRFYKMNYFLECFLHINRREQTSPSIFVTYAGIYAETKEKDHKTNDIPLNVSVELTSEKINKVVQ